MIDVAVIDYGTPELAARCVSSLRSDLFASIELVDSKRHGLSYAQAVNRSLGGGTAPYVLALNADTRMLEPPSKILALFEAEPEIAVIGPRQVDDHGRVTHAGILGDNHHRRHRFWLEPLALVDEQCRERALDVPTISGAVYFCRREVWERFGGFLEVCPHYYEETGLDFQIRHAGMRVVYTGESTWEHLWNRSPTDPVWRARMARDSQANFQAFLAARGIEAS